MRIRHGRRAVGVSDQARYFRLTIADFRLQEQEVRATANSRRGGLRRAGGFTERAPGEVEELLGTGNLNLGILG